MFGTGITVAFLGGIAGLGAGRCGTELLRRLRRGVRPPALCCEGGVALLWALVAVRIVAGALPLWWAAVPLLVGWLAVVLTTCDLLAGRLPDALTLSAYPATAAVLGLAACGGGVPGMASRALLGVVLFAGSYACVRLVSPSAMGAGDVKLAGSLGAVAGAVSPGAVLLTMAAAAVVTIAAAGVARRATVPHGPAMLLPAWLVTAFPSATSWQAGAW
ncbi:prepilin peptidase [Haloactinomyces albus]|uniref:Leader peptidase (Prepilin peptidase)/N-methyltransferase n=1 Tax=Haloactinomyces albus TaxID=1352928 RepID=A0AAE3ZFZ6_9ACTN|nr:prepilin peptidase [Haloactinomyces albus]MDR7303300.1 leader peptidase (prepilin peptidase)/N-methyltransferase [Haloactinomyces albus]